VWSEKIGAVAELKAGAKVVQDFFEVLWANVELYCWTFGRNRAAGLKLEELVVG